MAGGQWTSFQAGYPRRTSRGRLSNASSVELDVVCELPYEDRVPIQLHARFFPVAVSGVDDNIR